MASSSTALQNEINDYVRRGFIVQSQTETSAQLVKPKVFSFVWAFIWFLLLGVGVLVYIFYYMSKNDQTVYLSVEDGKVKSR